METILGAAIILAGAVSALAKIDEDLFMRIYSNIVSVLTASACVALFAFYVGYKWRDALAPFDDNPPEPWLIDNWFMLLVAVVIVALTNGFWAWHIRMVREREKREGLEELVADIRRSTDDIDGGTY